MSTKIFHGHRIRTATIPGGPLGLAAVFADALVPVERRLYLAVTTAIATRMRDQAKYAPPAPDRRLSWLLSAEAEIRDAAQRIAATGHRNPALDLACSVVAVPDPGAGGEWTYLLIYAEQPAYWDALRAIPGVEEYGYWNNTDRPGHCTEYDWTVRRQTWDRVIGNEPPALRGLTWEIDNNGRELRTPLLIGAADECAPYIPNRNERARAVAAVRALQTTPTLPISQLSDAVNGTVGAIAGELDDLHIAELAELAR